MTRRLEEGERIWRHLEYKLPPAEGVTNKDRVRLRMFERLVKEMPNEERKALYVWLVGKVHDCEHNFTEHGDSRTEEIERKHWQIYNSHLEVIYKWV